MEINMKNYNLTSFREKDLYTWDEIISKIEDLEAELYMKNEELENTKQDLEDNFKRISVNEQYEIYDDDFIEVI